MKYLFFFIGIIIFGIVAFLQGMDYQKYLIETGGPNVIGKNEPLVKRDSLTKPIPGINSKFIKQQMTGFAIVSKMDHDTIIKVRMLQPENDTRIEMKNTIIKNGMVERLGFQYNPEYADFIPFYDQANNPTLQTK